MTGHITWNPEQFIIFFWHGVGLPDPDIDLQQNKQAHEILLGMVAVT